MFYFPFFPWHTIDLKKKKKKKKKKKNKPGVKLETYRCPPYYIIYIFPFFLFIEI